MIRFLLVAVAVWLIPASVNGQIKPAKPQLELTAEVISQNYWGASSDWLMPAPIHFVAERPRSLAPV